MFGKKSSLPTTAIPSSEASKPLSLSQPTLYTTDTPNRRCTIIAQQSSFIGNIEVEGDIQIFGRVKGNIRLKEGILRVMKEGHIEGELYAPSITVNGEVQGTCITSNLEILEHGHCQGVIRTQSLSIASGGVFLGQSERLTLELAKSLSPTSFEQCQNHDNSLSLDNISLAETPYVKDESNPSHLLQDPKQP